MEKVIEREPDQSFEINGVRYAPIETKTSRHKPLPKSVSAIMAMASIFPITPYPYGYGESHYERELPKGTNIVKEFELIQNKQSRLSKWEREKVVRIFEQNYKQV